jgi:hypothetical protein
MAEPCGWACTHSPCLVNVCMVANHGIPGKCTLKCKHTKEPHIPHQCLHGHQWPK